MISTKQIFFLAIREADFCVKAFLYLITVYTYCLCKHCHNKASQQLFYRICFFLTELKYAFIKIFKQFPHSHQDLQFLTPFLLSLHGSLHCSKVHREDVFLFSFCTTPASYPTRNSLAISSKVKFPTRYHSQFPPHTTTKWLLLHNFLKML